MAIAADCKSVTLETSQVRLLLYPLKQARNYLESHRQCYLVKAIRRSEEPLDRDNRQVFLPEDTIPRIIQQITYNT